MNNRNKTTNILYTQSGFTLIELMVVIAIIAILASLLFSSYALYMEKTRLTVFFHNGYEIRREFAMFYNDHNRYPLNREEAIGIIKSNLVPYNMPYPWKHTTILDPDIYTKSCYKAIPAGSDMPQDYIWLWPLPNRSLTKTAIKMFLPQAVQIPYDTTCENAPEGTEYFMAITSTQVLLVGEH